MRSFGLFSLGEVEAELVDGGHTKAFCSPVELEFEMEGDEACIGAEAFEGLTVDPTTGKLYPT